MLDASADQSRGENLTFTLKLASDMGSSEEAKSSKSDKSSSSPAREQQNNVPIYPDWAAMQAYYGQRVAMPPYFNSAVTNGHPPPYMWGPPQMMMPPYGAPYAAIYSAGGVYAHPGVPYGSQALGQGVPTSAAANVTLAGTALSIDTPAKSSGNTNQESMKKLKSFDGLAMSIGNVNSEKAENEAEYKLQPKRSGLWSFLYFISSVSNFNGNVGSSESEGSSYGSDQNTDGAYDHKRKRNSEVTPPSESHEITESKPNPLPVGLVNSASEKVLGFPVTTTNGGGEMAGSVLAPPNVVTTLELRHAGVDVKANIATVTPNAIVSSETWMQNDRELKRERRKQSNRESARRSRLRKQAETEELAKRVEALTAENTALRTEINQLAENSNKLKLENSRLMGKLKEIQSEETSPNKTGLKKTVPVSTENLLSRVNNSGSGNSGESGGGKYDKGGSNSNSGAKLHQLLDASHRADAVAAR
ncbi:hypothetical protein V2J09_024321 [Rumex salicifolius]